MPFYSVDENNALNGSVDYSSNYRIFENLSGWNWMSLQVLVPEVAKPHDLFFLRLTMLAIALDSSVFNFFVHTPFWHYFELSETVHHLYRDNTRARVDMEYLFECSTHEWAINLNTRRDIPCLQATMYYFVYLLHKHTDNNVSDNFPNISDHSQEISGDYQKFVGRALERFLAFSEDNQRLPKTFE